MGELSHEREDDLACLWLGLHFPLLALEVHYTGEEAAVLVAKERVLLANACAKQAGIQSAMALATASSLCPQLRIYQQASEAETQGQLQELALWCGQFSAHISVYLPSSLVLEVASMQRYFGGVQAFWAQLEEALASLAYRATKSTGHTPLAALCLAKAKRNTCAVDAQGHQQILKTMPVSQIGLSAKQQSLLQGMGLYTFGHIEALERSNLSQRFGPELLNYIDRLWGRLPDPQTLFVPPHEFVLYRELYAEAEYANGLLFPLKPMLTTLFGYLRLIDQQAHELLLRLHHRDQTQDDLTLVHGQGAAEPNVWLELWRLKFENYRLALPVVAMTLKVTRFVEGQRVALDLFDTASHESSDVLINRLTSRLGAKAIQHFVSVADHRPEVAGQLLSGELDDVTVAARGRKTFVRGAGLAHRLMPLRPLWLLETPQVLDPEYVASCICFEFGPERVSTGWWQERVRRDYYQGRWPDGRLGWLFLDDRKEWYVHGWFG